MTLPIAPPPDSCNSDRGRQQEEMLRRLIQYALAEAISADHGECTWHLSNALLCLDGIDLNQKHPGQDDLDQLPILDSTQGRRSGFPQ